MFGTGIEGSLGVDHSIKEPPPKHTHTHHPFHYVQGPHAGTAFTPCDCSACVCRYLVVGFSYHCCFQGGKTGLRKNVACRFWCLGRENNRSWCIMTHDTVLSSVQSYVDFHARLFHARLFHACLFHAYLMLQTTCNDTVLNMKSTKTS